MEYAQTPPAGSTPASTGSETDPASSETASASGETDPANGVAGHDDGAPSAVSIDVTRGRLPWQATVSRWTGRIEIIETAGRPAVLTSNGVAAKDLLVVTGADGAQLTLAGSIPGGLTELADRLAPVAADDPLIHAPAR